jgi:hypothetical protein
MGMKWVFSRTKALRSMLPHDSECVDKATAVVRTLCYFISEAWEKKN